MTSGIQAGAVTAITKLLDRTMRTGIRWLLAALLMPCAMAQTPEADRQREYYREQDRQREEQQRRAQEEYQRQQRATEDTRKRQQQLDDETTKNIEDHSKRRAQAAPGGQVSADIRAERPKLLAMPPLPAERNVLLGSWRLEGSSQQRDAQQSRIAELAITGKGSLKPGDLQGFISSMDSGQMLCDASFGRGITFTPTTYSSGGAAGIAGGPLAYRSPNKQVIVAIPGDARANPMPFEIVGPNRIVWGGTCALVRVGSAAPAAQGGPPNRAPAPSNAGAPPAAAASTAGVADGAAFRCSDGSILQVSLCEGSSPDATCKLTRADVPLAVGTMLTRSAIATRVNGCEAGGIRYGADHKAVFVGAASGAPAATSRAPAPSSAAAAPPMQMANAAPAPMPSTLSRPSPEVCRQTLLDKLGTVGVNQVRAMSDVRFKEAAIEGKVPNTNNLRIDLRGSACDDPRIKATLYDFDANGMLQSITYVWARPAGPAPAPIFTERVATLSRFHSLPPPQSPSRLQADTSMGRLILEDLPERNLLLEAYKTPK